jgi:hypothetical protein
MPVQATPGWAGGYFVPKLARIGAYEENTSGFQRKKRLFLYRTTDK